MSMDVNRDIMEAVEDANNISDKLHNKIVECIRKCFREELFKVKQECLGESQKVYVIYYPQAELYHGIYGFVNDINDAQKFASKKAAKLIFDFDKYKKQIPYDGEIIFYGWRNRGLWLKD